MKHHLINLKITNQTIRENTGMNEIDNIWHERTKTAMNYGLDNLVGDSSSNRKVKKIIEQIARTDINLIISGEVGTGRSHTAHVIHHHSSRRNNQPIIIDCSKVMGNGITNNIDGINDSFEQIITSGLGSTIILQNLESMSIPTQEILEHTLVNLNRQGQTTRILSTASSDINELVDNSRFSRYLYSLLSELTIELLPLRNRLEDIENIFEHLIVKFTRETDQPLMQFTPGALNKLLKYNWPGNIPELIQTIKEAMKLNRDGLINRQAIVIDGLHETFDTSAKKSGKEESKSNGRLMDEGQRTLILKTLDSNDWNFTHTARKLGIGRTTLWRKVKKYDLNKETVKND